MKYIIIQIMLLNIVIASEIDLTSVLKGEAKDEELTEISTKLIHTSLKIGYEENKNKAYKEKEKLDKFEIYLERNKNK